MDSNRLPLIIWLIVAALFGSLSAQDDEDVYRSLERRYLPASDHQSIHRYHAYTIIEESEAINGDVLVIDHDLVIYGLVDGDILVINGDVKLFGGSEVRGEVTAVGGTIFLYNDSRVRGEMIQKDWRGIFRKPSALSSQRHYGYQGGTNINIHDSDTDLAIRYNRVDGLFLGLAAPKQYYRRVGNFSGYGFVGYAFESEAVRYQVGLDRWIFSPVRFRTEIGAEFHDITDTQDLWKISTNENSLGAFFLREDFQDYYRRRGFSFYLGQNLSKYLRLGLEYRNDDYMSLNKNTNWSLFGGDKRFRPNPSLGDDAANMRSIYGELKLDTRKEWEPYDDGVMLHLSGETSTPGLGGAFDFRRYTAEMRWFQRIGRSEQLRFRIFAGTADGYLPLQRIYSLGGISTLRALPYKSLVGDRAFLMNLEYQVNPDFIDFLFDDINFILFADAGDAWQSGGEDLADSFKYLSLNRLKSDLGFAVADEDNTFRINFAWRTDVAQNNDVVVTFRIQQPF